MALVEQRETADGRRMVLYRVGRTGLGHVLSAILNLAMWARREGRGLVIDAANFQYFANDAHRQFCECFALEGPKDLAVTTNPTAVRALHDDPSKFHVRNPEDLPRASERPERVVLVHGTWLISVYPLAARQTPPLVRVALRGWLRERIDANIANLRNGGPIIGIYFRHGNGEHLLGRFDTGSFPDYAARLGELQRRYAQHAKDIAAAQGWSAPRHFIASDNAGFVTAMRALLPNCITLAQKLPDRNYAEHLASEGHDPEILFEAVQDAWALSACSALIYSASLFARLAILNSETLDVTLTRDIEAPILKHVIPKLSPRQAILFAESAYRAAQTTANAMLLAAEYARVGDVVSEVKIRRRIEWHQVWTSDSFIRQARIAVSQSRLDQAQAQMRRILALHVENPYVLMLHARILRGRGKHDEAIAALRAAVDIDDGISEVNQELAVQVASRDAIS